MKYSKHFTVDQRRRIVAESRRRRAAERTLLPPEEQGDVDLIMMKRQLEGGSPHGKWNDLWFEHPNPTMNEPHKAMCWLTPDDGLDADAQAEMFLASGLARVDNVFQMTRRLINAFERPLGTSSSQNTVWHGYQPYNPAMIGKYLTIFRTVTNFISVGPGREDTGDATWAGKATAHLRGHPVAGRDGAAATARPPEGEAAQRPAAHAAR